MGSFYYQPGVSDRSGELLGRGFAGGMGSIADGVARAKELERQQKEKDAALKAENDRNTKILELLGHSPGQVASMSLGEKRGALDGIEYQIKQAREEREAREAELRLRQIQDAMQQQQAERGAMRIAFGGAPSRQELGAMLQNGGTFESTQTISPEVAQHFGAAERAAAAGVTNTAMLNALSEIDANRARATARLARPEPTLRDFGVDQYGRKVQGLVDANGNVKVIQAPESNPGVPSQLDRLIRERDAWKAQGRDDVVKEYDKYIEKLSKTSDVSSLFGMLAGSQGASSNAAIPAPTIKITQEN